jgi:hypothetical protein
MIKIKLNNLIGKPCFNLSLSSLDKIFDEDISSSSSLSSSSSSLRFITSRRLNELALPVCDRNRTPRGLACRTLFRGLKTPPNQINLYIINLKMSQAKKKGDEFKNSFVFLNPNEI